MSNVVSGPEGVRRLRAHFEPRDIGRPEVAAEAADKLSAPPIQESIAAEEAEGIPGRLASGVARIVAAVRRTSEAE